MNTEAPSPFSHCPVCGSATVMLLDLMRPEGTPVPIVGCGNPWHYGIGSEGSVTNVSTELLEVSDGGLLWMLTIAAILTAVNLVLTSVSIWLMVNAS